MTALLGAPILRSALLDEHGFAHGFSLRTGGVSEGPFATLNLGRTVGDEPAAVEDNLRRFCAEVGCEPQRLFEVSQVHGRAVELVRAASPGGPMATVGDVRGREADALVSSAPGAAVAVRTADCLPLLLADPGSGAVAAVHAGWRGVAARIVDTALDALLELGDGSPRALLAAIGPHIRAEAFEVGPEVAERIAAAAHGEPVVIERSPRPHVDLARAVRAQLLHRGLVADRVDDVGGCTLSEPERFFSHRRDRGRTGRHLSAIVSRA